MPENKPASFAPQHRTLLFSLLLGLVSVLLAYVYIQGRITRVSGGGLIPVAVADAKIPDGTIITRPMLRFQAIPAAYVHNKMVRAANVDLIVGQKAASDIDAGQPILFTDIFPDNLRSLSDRLQVNERAISLALDGTSAVSGLIVPGDRVDLLLNTTRKTGSSDPITRPLLQNVTVLAVNGQAATYQLVPGGAAQAASMGGSHGGSSLTLKVTAPEAALLAFAEANGQLRVILRNRNDVIVEQNPHVVTAGDLAGSGSETGAATPPGAARRPGYPAVIEDGKPDGNGYLPDDSGQLQKLQNLQRQIQNGSYLSH